MLALRGLCHPFPCPLRRRSSALVTLRAVAAPAWGRPSSSEGHKAGPNSTAGQLERNWPLTASEKGPPRAPLLREFLSQQRVSFTITFHLAHLCPLAPQGGSPHHLTVVEVTARLVRGPPAKEQGRKRGDDARERPGVMGGCLFPLLSGAFCQHSKVGNVNHLL